MEQTAAEISWLGIIAGTIVAFLVGWLWYSPKLFGKGWAEGSKVDLGSASEMPVMAMGVQVVALFLLSLLIGITASTEALFTAILAILAAAAFVVSGGAFSGKSNYALGVDGGYILVSGAIMIVCQGIF